jgi:hypothetical protein
MHANIALALVLIYGVIATHIWDNLRGGVDAYAYASLGACLAVYSFLPAVVLLHARRHPA